MLRAKLLLILLSLSTPSVFCAEVHTNIFPIVMQISDFDPDVPFRKKDTCPGEGCRLEGEWKYDKPDPLPVYQEPRGTRRLTFLKRGETFVPISADSFINPWKIEIIKSGPYFQKGDMLFILDEGPETSYWHAVYKENLIDLYGGPQGYRPVICKAEYAESRSDCTAIERSPAPKGDNDGEWWIKIKSEKGIVGWVLWWNGNL